MLSGRKFERKVQSDNYKFQCLHKLKVAVLIFLCVIGAILNCAQYQCAVNAEIQQEDVVIPDLNQLNNWCDAFCAMDITTGEVLISKEKDMRIFPASMTKIMTAQIAMDYLDLNDMLVVSSSVKKDLTADSTLMNLYSGEEVKVSDLYFGLLLNSGNDAANVLAEGVIDVMLKKYPVDSGAVGPDGVGVSYILQQLGKQEGDNIDNKIAAFTCLMNLRARNIGCIGTNFANAHGLDAHEHYTTASDMIIMMRNALKHQEFRDIISTPTHVCTTHGMNSVRADLCIVDVEEVEGDKSEKPSLHSQEGISEKHSVPFMASTTNDLLLNPWLSAKTSEGDDTHLAAVIGGKTGTTIKAGKCLTIDTINENGHEVIVSICGCRSSSVKFGSTMFFASAVAYANYECWKRDPTTVLPGTIGDYQKNNWTANSKPICDPVIDVEDKFEGGKLNNKNNTVGMDDNQECIDAQDTDSTKNGESSISSLSESKKQNSFVKFWTEHKNMCVVAILSFVFGVFSCSIIVLVMQRIKNKKHHKRRKKVKLRPAVDVEEDKK